MQAAFGPAEGRANDREDRRLHISSLFEKLGVQTIDPACYLEVGLEGHGTFSITEGVKGFLKLRGNVVQADVLATRMPSRSMQKSLHNVEAVRVTSACAC